MIVYKGHPIFDYVYVVTANVADKGRLRGYYVSDGGCWKLQDHQQPLGTGHTPGAYATEVLGLTPVEVTAETDEFGNITVME